MDQRTGDRGLSRLAATIVALTVLAVPLGCATPQQASTSASGEPPRLTPTPDEAAAKAMESVHASTDLTLDACALLDLTPVRIAALTGTNLGDTEAPVAGHARNICTYGGPGSEPTTSPTGTTTSTGATSTATSTGTTGTVTSTGTSTTEPTGTGPTGSTAITTTAGTSTTSTTTGDPGEETGPRLDTVTVAVVEPGDDVATALADLPRQVAPTYSCSEVRGTGATSTPSDAATEDAQNSDRPGPPPAEPELATSYVDCVTTPTGGGTEVHTIMVDGSRLWHLVATRPDTPREPAAEARGLVGLHRLAMHILS